MPGCYTFKHTVGSGGNTGQVQKEGAWFILWGLVPLGAPNSKTLASGATDYTITTRFEVVDVIITFFTSVLTIYKQTVTVKT